MRVSIKNGKAYFLDYTDRELAQLKSRLNWEDERADPPRIDSLLFFEGGVLWTYEGILELLLQDPALKIEMSNEIDPAIQEWAVTMEVDRNILPGIELFEFQAAAIRKMFMLREGLVEIPTSGGKMEIFFAFVQHMRRLNGSLPKTLFIVPSKPLASQCRMRAVERGFAENEIGVVHGESKQFDRAITVAVVNSIAQGLASGDEDVVRLVSECAVLVLDESHHGRSVSWSSILKSSAAEYKIGFTGSPYQNDDILKTYEDAVVKAMFKRVIYRISYRHLREIGLISELAVYMCSMGGQMLNFKGRWQKIYESCLMRYSKRNDKIVEMVRLMHRMGFPCLVMVQRKEHASLLFEELKLPDSICVFGGEKGIMFDENMQSQDVTIDSDQFIDEYQTGKWKVAIVTQVLDEGISLPAIGCVIMAGGGRSRIKMVQRTGRGLRKKVLGTNRVYLIDFMDRKHVWLMAHSKKRRALYEMMEAKFILSEDLLWSMLFDHSNEIQRLKGFTDGQGT